MTYDPNRYVDCTDDGVLKISFALWFILLLETWHWLSYAIFGIAVTQVGETATLFSTDQNWAVLAGQIPGLIVFFSATRRSPAGGIVVRAIWRQGRFLLFLAATLGAGLSLYKLINLGDGDDYHARLYLIEGVLHLLATVAVWKDPYFCDVFREFPAPAAENAEHAQDPKQT